MNQDGSHPAQEGFRRFLVPPAARIRAYLVFFLVVLAGKATWVLLFRTGGEALLSGRERADLMARRAYLLSRLLEDRAGPKDMPSYLPGQFQGEWAVGTLSMVAAALANMGVLYPETRTESAAIIARLVERVQTPAFREFDRARWGEDPIDALGGRCGHAGYLGHLAWMLDAYRHCGGDGRHDALGRAVHAGLARRVMESPSAAIETYPGETYVPDNLVVLAALACHDRLTGTGRSPAIDRWIVAARKRWMDPRTGLLAFRLDAQGAVVEGPRGSGAGWNSFYLPFVDPALASDQFDRIRSHLIHTLPFGVTGILEFPRGVEGSGDVDSGPVVLGLSTSGTGFAVAGARQAGDASLVGKLLLTAELVGSTVEWDGRRRYLIAPLVGDAIMLAMKTAVVWPLPSSTPGKP